MVKSGLGAAAFSSAEPCLAGPRALSAPTMANPANRPTSPHLTVWRWGPGMLVSILHRVTGAGLAILGLGILTWWLMAIATGADAYATFVKFASSWLGLIVLV